MLPTPEDVLDHVSYLVSRPRTVCVSFDTMGSAPRMRIVMFRVQLCFDRPGACTGTEENKRNAPTRRRPSLCGRRRFGSPSAAHLGHGRCHDSHLAPSCSLGINRIVLERGLGGDFLQEGCQIRSTVFNPRPRGGDTDIAGSSTHAHRKFPSVFWFREGQSEGQLSERNESCLGVSAYQ